MKLIIGCPVRDRAWVLPQWFEHVDVAMARVEAQYGPDVDYEYAFVIGSCSDNTPALIAATNARVLHTAEGDIPVSDRRWTTERFSDLVTARNGLLQIVRYEQPDFFVSVDSDILLHPNAIVNLLESYWGHEGWSAVGGKLYMTPSGTHTPSYAFNKAAGGLAREDSDGVFEAQIIMALKLMDEDAYNVDYVHSEKGEDVGWSLACHTQGLRFGWDGRVTNKHVMLKRQLHEVDARVGF